jgi:hypothetical protein
LTTHALDCEREAVRSVARGGKYRQHHYKKERGNPVALTQMAVGDNPLIQMGKDFIKREGVNLAGKLLDKGGEFLKSKLKDKLAKW